jgi:hypothetical protein
MLKLSVYSPPGENAQRIRPPQTARPAGVHSFEEKKPMPSISRRPFLATLAGGLAGFPILAQQTEAPRFVPKQSDRPAQAQGDEPGFQPIFDGKTLEGWEGDPKYWRVENGCLVGEITPETILKSNTFIIWSGGKPKDFELKVDYRITEGGNSGINYRSAIVPDRVTPSNQFAMRGYQFDIDGRNRYTGQNYEEKGRLFLALRGQMTHVLGTQLPLVIASLGESEQLAAFIRSDWNSAHIIARGNILTHILNGHMMSQVIDDDPVGRTLEGQIGVQVHVGPPMKVEYRNFRLKTLE